MMTKATRKASSRARALMAGTALCSLMAGTYGAAAQTANGVAAQSSNQIETVVVTSERQQQNLQDVPASISVVSGADLTNQHIVTADDLTRAVPGITFSPSNGTSANVGVGSESLVVRGVSSAIGSSTVGLYIDDVPITLLNQAGTFIPKLTDLDRVEVLRGPQGTLYGASSEGGTVRFITRQPNVDALSGEVSANASYTDHASGANTDETAVVNIPVSSTFAIRAGGEFTYDSGWIDQYANKPGTILTPSTTLLKSGVNLERDYAARISATYQPDDSLTITPSFLYQREHQNDAPTFYVQSGLPLFEQSNSVAQPATDEGMIASLTVVKHFSDFDLTSVSSYFSRDYDRNSDGTYYDSDYVVPYILDYDARTKSKASIANTTLGIQPVTVVNKDGSKAVNQEVRLSSPAAAEGERSLSWVVGAFYSHSTDHSYHNEQSPGFNALFQNIYGFSINDPVNSPLADPSNPNTWQDNFLLTNTNNGITQYAGFGQVDYEILPGLKASAGVRYQLSKLNFSYVGQGYYDIGIANESSKTTDSSLTPKFTLGYAINEDQNLYATASKGYRDGGSNSPIPQSICAANEASIGLSGAPPGTYRPDSLWNYEAGYKGVLADRQLSVNVDGYDIEWSNVQQQIKIPGCGFRYTTNVGSAEAYGTELEIQYKPNFVEGLTLGGSATAEHATITQIVPHTVATVGESLLFTPQWTATLTASYTRPIGDGLRLNISADSEFEGESNGDFKKTASDYINHAYNVVNGSINVLTEGGLEAGVFAKNLTNNATIIRSPTIASVVEGYTVPPMTIGIQLKQRY